MSSGITRVRYHDRQILRAQDLQADQNYHIEMRRRHNRGLHLFGVVDGLEVVGKGATKVVTQGMAIDRWGRELFLREDTELGPDLFLPEAVIGPMYLILRYQRQPQKADPGQGCRSAGSSLLEESAELFLVKDKPIGPDDVATNLGATPADDPRREADVILGQVEISKPSKTYLFGDLIRDERDLIGIRACRIQPAGFTKESEPGEHTLTNHGLAERELAVEVAGDLLTKGDLVVGQNFKIEKLKDFKDKKGDGKVAGDLFVQGEVFSLFVEHSTPPDPKKDVPSWRSINQLLGGLKAEQAALQGEIANLKAGNTTLDKANKDLAKDVQDVKTEIATVKGTVQVLENKIGRRVPDLDVLAMETRDLSNAGADQTTQTLTKLFQTNLTAGDVEVIVGIRELVLGEPAPNGTVFLNDVQGITELQAVGNLATREVTVKFKVGRTWEDPATHFHCEIKKISFSVLVVCLPPA